MADPDPYLDEVDRLVAAWSRERPDIDATPLEVLSRITRLAHHLDTVRRHTFEVHELETWEFDVLAALRRNGAPYVMSPGALSAATLVTSGTMTNRLDNLQRRGLITREPDPQDKRGVVVQLTSDGRSRVDAALDDLLTRERIVLRGLSRQDLSQTARSLRTLLRDFEADHDN